MIRLEGSLIGAAVALVIAIGPATAAAANGYAPGGPAVLRDGEAARFLPAPPAPTSAHPEVIQPDTQIEPSIAVNPGDPRNVVTSYQEGRVDGGGDMTNGYATTFDGGKTWTYGELPCLTYTVPEARCPSGGIWDRASDAVVAFGPDRVVYANSLVFDDETVSPTTTQHCSGIAVNVSKDGGRSWSLPVVFQDDCSTGNDDKNWITVDMGSGTGHHFGRVYAVWDRIAPVAYNYCDANCDNVANWLPNYYTISSLQGIGAQPLVLSDGSLGVLYSSITGSPLTLPGEQPQTGTSNLQWALAPGAGNVVWPAPLTFTQLTIPVAPNGGSPVRLQRAGSLPGADVDPKTGTIFVGWEDGRFRTESSAVVNDPVMVASTNIDGLTWGPVTRIDSQAPTGDYVDRYNVSVAGSSDGIVRFMYRQRQEAASGRNFSLAVDTYYQETHDGGQTFTAPLKVNTGPSHALYGAESRAGLFQGDYNQLVSAGGFTYVARDESYPLQSGETPGLVCSASSCSLNVSGCPNRAAAPSCLTHLHQRTWVAVLGAAVAASPSPAAAAQPPAGLLPLTSPSPAAVPLTLLITLAALALLASARRARR